MELLFVTHKYPPVVGGMEKHAFELLAYLRKHHTVRELIYDNQEGRLTFFRSLKARIGQLLERYPGIELIYFNEGLLAGIGARIKAQFDVPMLATIHGLDVTYPLGLYQSKIVEKLQYLDGIIAVSAATAKACVARGLDAAKVFTVPNGIDHDLAKVNFPKGSRSMLAEKYDLPLAGKRILVTMGRPVKRKGFSWFVEQVFPYLPPDTVFLLIGPRRKSTRSWTNWLPGRLQHYAELAVSVPSDEAALKSVAQQQERVFELGKLPWKDIPKFLSISDLFVMPNVEVEGDMEGFGLVALEAAICGTPVVAAGIEGITSAIHDGKNGVHLPSGDAKAWRHRLTRLLKQTPEELNAFGAQAKRYTLDNFSWEKMGEEYVQAFREVLNR